MKKIMIALAVTLMFSSSYATEANTEAPQEASTEEVRESSLGPEESANDGAGERVTPQRDRNAFKPIEGRNNRSDADAGWEDPAGNDSREDRGVERLGEEDMQDDQNAIDRTARGEEHGAETQNRKRKRRRGKIQSTGNEGLDKDIREANNDHGLCKIKVIRHRKRLRFHIQSKKTNCERYSRTTRKAYGFFNSALSMHNACERRMLGCRIVNGVESVVDGVVDAGADVIDWLERNRDDNPPQNTMNPYPFHGGEK